MKLNRLFAMSMVVALLVGTSAWRLAAQGQIQIASDSLSQWQYPDGSGFGTQLTTLIIPGLPYGGLQGKTNDTIEKVYAFYRSKATGGLDASRGFNWQGNAEITLLVNQSADGQSGFSEMSVPRQLSDSALVIVHQPSQTTIIKLSRDAQNRSKTDISIVIDKR